MDLTKGWILNVWTIWGTVTDIRARRPQLYVHCALAVSARLVHGAKLSHRRGNWPIEVTRLIVLPVLEHSSP